MSELKVGDKGRHTFDMTPEAWLEIIDFLPDNKMKVYLLNPQAWIDDEDYYTVNRSGFVKNASIFDVT